MKASKSRVAFVARSTVDSQGIRNEMMEFYVQKAAVRGGGGWRAVGEMMGCSGAYARQIANGEKPVTPRIAVAWMIATSAKKRQRRPRTCIEVSPETAARLRERKLPGETWDETLERLLSVFHDAEAAS